MTESKPPRKLFRFGLFELDTDTGDLRLEGNSCPRIRDQAFRILVMLMETPGALVTREELRERVWSADTFVDFDHGLNTAINQLRNVLGDSAASPRFIQTLPRRGYRFIAPVEVIPDQRASFLIDENTQSQVAAPPALLSDRELAASQKTPSSLLSDSRDLPSVPNGIVRTLFSMIQVMYLIFYVVSMARLSKVEEIFAAFADLKIILFVVLIVTAAIGIPIRLYLLSAAAFNYRGLSNKFQKLFLFILLLDELWALAPFLLLQQIGTGLAIAFTAALVYVPFSQRSLLLMDSTVLDGHPKVK